MCWSGGSKEKPSNRQRMPTDMRKRSIVQNDGNMATCRCTQKETSKIICAIG
jgi:hypothetical protein